MLAVKQKLKMIPNKVYLSWCFSLLSMYLQELAGVNLPMQVYSLKRAQSGTCSPWYWRRFTRRPERTLPVWVRWMTLFKVYVNLTVRWMTIQLTSQWDEWLYSVSILTSQWDEWLYSVSMLTSQWDEWLYSLMAFQLILSAIATMFVSLPSHNDW